MKKLTKPHKPFPHKNIFTEGINYFEAGKGSIWGRGDADTLKVLRGINLKGSWLNLAAGDGRYNLILLKKADTVLASDIDEGALSKLWHTTPKEYRHKLKTKAFDISKKFPFKDKTFDGIFCTGTLHHFSKELIRGICKEIDRVLKPGGRVILDFATDIRTELPDGKLFERDIYKNYKYKINPVINFLKSCFSRYDTEIYEFSAQEKIKEASGPLYRFSCKFALLIAVKDN